ncbi:MAG: YceI family protein [Acidobacteriota bacterium]|nr:YceI family protein [Acidobacteriota bacterium]
MCRRLTKAARFVSSVRVALLLVFALSAGIARAQTAASASTLHLDPAGTSIRWTLKGNLHTVHGTFQLKSGLITFDPKTGAAQGEIIIETASGASGEEMRDRRMQKDVLESTKYPEAIFHPDKVMGVVRAGRTQTATVEGTFTIHGADHPLTLQVQTSWNGDVVSAKTSFTVPYVAWGMKDPSTLMLRVGKEVQVEIDSRGSVE